MASESASDSMPLDVLALRAESGGQIEHDNLINAFLDAVVVVPSGTNPGKDPLEPVMIDIDHVSHMLVCDSLATANNATDLAPYGVSMRGSDVVRGTSPGFAILVRTTSTGFAIDEALLNEIRGRREA